MFGYGKGSTYELQLMDVKVIFSAPASAPSKLSKLRRLVLSTNISDSADSQIRRMNKNSLVGGRHKKKKCYLKMRKCQAFARRGWNISATESRVEWESTVQSVLQLRNCVKVGKWRIDRRGIWRSSAGMNASIQAIMSKLSFSFMHFPICAPVLACTPLLTSQKDAFLLTFT